MFNKRLVFIFGRFQVPTKGHAEMIRYGADYAKRIGAEFRVYTSKSWDPKKNPLPYQQKIMFLRQLFPGVNVVDDPNVRTAFDICRKLSDQGVEDVTMITGGDRVAEFKTQIGKYVMDKSNPKFDKTKNYAFTKFNVISSGARKTGISGTQMREYIRGGKFKEFARTAPTTDKELAKKIFATAKSYLKEEMTHKEFQSHLKRFVDFTVDKLGIKEVPELEYKIGSDENADQPSFGGYSPCSKKIIVASKNRHPMDIFRTVAHELVHHKQNEDGKLGKDIAREGATGSPIEDEANYMAGRVMRWFGKANPDMFGKSYVIESKAIVLGGVPGSGKDKILKEAILPHGFREVSDRLTIKECNGDNLVINGTMADYNQTKQIKELLESAGYRTIMVFVNTSNEVSKQRNEARAFTGGRVIAEDVRYDKWRKAQFNLNRYDQLFEKVIEVNNNLDANTIRETYDQFTKSISKEIGEFAINDVDRLFENMLEDYSDFSPKPKNNPVGGAGNWGTPKLTNRYKSDTPGQEPGKTRAMGYFQPKVFGNAPIKADRVGTTFTSAKNPSFVGDITGDINPFITPEPMQTWSPIDRWMVKEETRKRFKQKYGQLAEQKMKETAEKLRKESLVDPYMGSMGMTPNASNIDDVKPDINAEFEKMSLFGKRKSKKTKYKE